VVYCTVTQILNALNERSLHVGRPDQESSLLVRAI
jgi:hypothetical protein